MLRKLYGTCLMNIDVTCADTNNALVLIKHRVDGGGIGLRTSSEKEYLCIGQSADLTDMLLGTFREIIEAIGRWTCVIMSYKGF